MRRLALAIVPLTGLVVVATAAAHIVVSPSFLPTGGTGRLELEVPNERDETMTSLTVTLPDGLTADSAESANGFAASVGDGSTISWTGGSIDPDVIAHFAFTGTASAPPGTLTLRATQAFADGEVQRWAIRLTIVPESGPAPEQHPNRAIVAAAIGIVVILGSLVLVRRFRRTRTSR